MNLLTDDWIPVRPLGGGACQQITLQTLLCNGQRWLVALPRDDMEMATFQLLICLLQTLWMPSDAQQLIQRIRQPLSAGEFADGVAGWQQAFDLNHPQQPFMQVRGVAAKEVTAMDKLLVGLTGSGSGAFVNQPGQGKALCGGCTAIALFNQACNAPGFGGGFKCGLRGESPVTTLVQGDCLRTTIWFNVLSETTLDQFCPGWREQRAQPFTWQQPIKKEEVIAGSSIGLARGLFWQPAHIELSPPDGAGQCSACGRSASQRYRSFLKERFKFYVDGLWLHPHSPLLQQIKKGQVEWRYMAFSTPAPSWTQIGRLLIEQQVNKQQEGRRVATTVGQARMLSGGRALRLMIGGYRNNKAKIIERRHEVLQFNQGWQHAMPVINEIVTLGLEYRKVLRTALWIFAEGAKESGIKGAGVALHEKVDAPYYRQSQARVLNLLAQIDFQSPLPQLAQFQTQQRQLCLQLFNDLSAPYAHHPKLICSLAQARRYLTSSLAKLQPQGEHIDGAAV